VIAASRARNDPQSHLEELPYVTPFTDEAALATQRPDDATTWLTPARLFEQTAQRNVEAKAPEFIVLPTPYKAAHSEGPAIDLTKGVRLVLHDIRAADIAPALAALKHGVQVGDAGAALAVTADPTMKPESYRIAAANGAIAITAADAAGASYALRSLAQQAVYERLRLTPLEIEDAPRFAFRGLMLDIARWRRKRRDELTALGDKVARRVLESGEREQLSPMTPFERKIVHDAVAAVDGVRSESEGVEPARRVVVLVD